MSESRKPAEPAPPVEHDHLRDFRDQRDVRAEGWRDPITGKVTRPDPILEPDAL